MSVGHIVCHCASGHPSCVSQVVFVWKKTGEIHFCVHYRKLNSITIWDAFPLSHIDEALQVVHDCNVFTSFDLVQGYLQLAMAEDDIKKTTFRAVFQAYTSLLICLLACPMLHQASAG